MWQVECSEGNSSSTLRTGQHVSHPPTCLQRRLRTLSWDLPLSQGEAGSGPTEAPVASCFPHISVCSDMQYVLIWMFPYKESTPPSCRMFPAPRSPCHVLTSCLQPLLGNTDEGNHSKMKGACCRTRVLCLHTCGPARCGQNPSHVVSWAHLLGYGKVGGWDQTFCGSLER